MCGIAGMIGLDANNAICQAMLKTMERRGPDGSGIYRDYGCTLLHSRLAIIDPAGGKQPMSCHWNGCDYTISYNGELYNTDEIRNHLICIGHEFLTSSDTEVVLHAFAQWGEASLEQLNGIFAFAIWNSTDKKLFIARDRMGVKPLFYSQFKNGLLFASEMKTLLAYPGMRAELDAEAAAQIILLGPGRMPGSGVFHNIYELEPACCGWFENEKLRCHRYWWLKDRIHSETFEETAEQVRYLVMDAIRKQMVSDVPIGTFLSGGLDSSLISAVCAARMKEKGERLRTFSLDYRDNAKYFVPGKFQPNADSDYINIMQTFLNCQPYNALLTPEELLDALEDATIARDLPGMADVDFSLLVFCRQIREHVKVALSGECADEIFGGYPWYRDPNVRNTNGFPWAQNTQHRASFLAPWIKQTVSPYEYVNSAYESTINQADILPGTSPLEKRMKQMVNLNYYWFMQTLLDRKDRMSMYSGLEVRVPFCDYRIAEYMYAVPWEFKDHGGYEKGLLRYAMRRHIPDEILWRKKSPYPKTHDPLYTTLVKDRMQMLLQDNESPLLQIVNKESLNQLMEGELQWPWYGQLMQMPQTIAYMLQIDFWMRKYDATII